MEAHRVERKHWITFDLWLMPIGSPQAQSLSQLTATRVNSYGEPSIQALPRQGEARPADFNVDDFGVARAQAARFMPYGAGIV